MKRFRLLRLRGLVSAPSAISSLRMSDVETTVSELREKILAFARERDWEKFHSPKNLSMALAGEAAELMEHFLWLDGPESVRAAEDPDRAQSVRAELADVVIYALEFANVCEIDLSDAILEKLRENAAKYPVEKARGNARKYTELD